MKTDPQDQNKTPLAPKDFDAIFQSRRLDLNIHLKEWWINRTSQNEQLEK